MLTSAFPPAERGRALGPERGDRRAWRQRWPDGRRHLTEQLTWRWIFYVNVPLGIIGLIATVRVLTRERSARQAASIHWGRYRSPSAWRR